MVLSCTNHDALIIQLACVIATGRHVNVNQQYLPTVPNSTVTGRTPYLLILPFLLLLITLPPRAPCHHPQSFFFPPPSDHFSTFPIDAYLASGVTLPTPFLIHCSLALTYTLLRTFGHIITGCNINTAYLFCWSQKPGLPSPPFRDHGADDDKVWHISGFADASLWPVYEPDPAPDGNDGTDREMGRRAHEDYNYASVREPKGMHARSSLFLPALSSLSALSPYFYVGERSRERESGNYMYMHIC